MSNSQRRKGAAWERDLANRWKNSGLYPKARRGTGQARKDAHVPDVDGTPWWVECKVGQRPNLLGALRQAEDARDAAALNDRGHRPVLVVAKLDRQGSMVLMRLADFEAMAAVVEWTAENRATLERETSTREALAKPPCLSCDDADDADCGEHMEGEK